MLRHAARERECSMNWFFFCEGCRVRIARMPFVFGIIGIIIPSTGDFIYERVEGYERGCDGRGVDRCEEDVF